MTTHQNQNFFNLVTLTVPVARNKKSGFQSAIASSLSINEHKISIEPEFYERMHILGLRNFNLVIINDDLIGYKKSNIGNNLLNVNCSLTAHYINTDTFFSLKSFDFFFNRNKEKSFEFVFAFQNLPWNEICARFIGTGIDISGGSNTKKHLISPVQHRLSLFLMCIFGSKSTSFINESFHRDFKESEKKGFDNSTKQEQNLIIDFARANEILKSRILAEGPIDFSSIEDLNENEEATQKTTSSRDKNNNKATHNSELNSQINNNNSTQHNNNLDKPSLNSNREGGILNNPKINQFSVAVPGGTIRKFHSSACLFDNKSFADITNVNDLSITPPTKFMLFPKNTILANFIGSIEQEIISAAALTSDESQRQKIQLKF